MTATDPFADCDDAKESWAKYEQFAKANPETKTYPATPPERVKRIQTWKKMLKDYGCTN